MSIDVISFSKAMEAIRKAGFIGEKDSDTTGVTNGDIVKYSEDLDKFITDKLRVKVELWQPNYEYERGEIIVWDEILHWVVSDHTSHGTDIEFDIVEGHVIPFVTEAGLSNVLALDYEIVSEGSEVVISWQNPSQATYEGREVYFSNTINITPLRHNEIQDIINAGGDVELVSSGIGSGQGNTDSFTKPVEVRNQYYTKVFVNHYDGESDLVSTGRFLVINNPDIYPPAPPTNLSAEIMEDSITLTWSQPTDEDFFHTRVVRSTSQMPTNPSDGTVLGAVSGVGEFVDNDVVESVLYYYKLFSFDDAGSDGMQTGEEGNWNSSVDSEITVEIVPIFGFNLNTGERYGSARNLLQEDFNDIYPWNSMSRAVVNSAGDVVYYLDSEDSAYKDGGVDLAVLDGTDGNVVVEIPEFYYNNNNGILLISEEDFPNAKYNPRTLVGAFEASQTDNGELASIAGVDPLTGKSMSEYRELVGNIGTGWQQRDMKTLNVIKMMFLIEYGDFNSQQIIGDGLVNSTNPEGTGSTLELGSSTGIATNGAVSYRGIENAWGNVWEFIEGLVVTDTDYYVADDGFGSFAGDSNTGTYTGIGVTPITQSGFISSFIDSKHMIGAEVGGDNTTFVGDHQFSHGVGETNLAVHGGNYADEEKAGLFRIHMGVNKFAKEDDMELIKTYQFYSEEVVQTENNSTGVLVDENVNLTIDTASVEGQVYDIDLHRQLSEPSVQSIDLIEVIGGIANTHRILLVNENGSVIDMDYTNSEWVEVATEFSNTLFEDNGFEATDLANFIDADWAELYTMFGDSFKLVAMIEKDVEGTTEVPVIRQQNTEFLMTEGYVYEKELTENELSEIKGIMVY